VSKSSKKTYKCLCGKKHKFQNSEVIQTHFYVYPHGCTDGDYWLEGELQIICPTTNCKNRVLFDEYKVPYEKRNEYKWSLELQFKRKYKKMFKKVINDYNDDSREWKNCYYIDKHAKKYGLKLG